MATIDEYPTQDGTSYKITWYVPRSMVPAGKSKLKQSTTVYDHGHALLAKSMVEDARAALIKEDLDRLLEDRLRPRISTGITVAEWAESFLELKESEVRTRTWNTYRSQLRDVIVPELGRKPLKDLTGQDIHNFISKIKRERKISNKTCDRYFALLKHMMHLAVTNKKIERNEADFAGWKLNKPDPTSGEDDHAERFFEPAEYKQLLAQVRPDFRLFIQFLCETGVRFSEATNLKVRDLDFTDNSARIRFVMSEGEEELPKSGKKRTIEVPEALMVLIQDLVRGKSEDDLVFTSSRGKAIINTNFRRDHWDPAMIRLRQCSRHLPERVDGRNGLTVYDPHSPSSCACLGSMTWTTFTPHSLRHTYATWMLREGRSITLVSKQLGHSTTKVTETIYAHLEKWWKHDRESRLSNTLDEVLGRERLPLVSV